MFTSCMFYPSQVHILPLKCLKKNLQFELLVNAASCDWFCEEAVRTTTGL